MKSYLAESAKQPVEGVYSAIPRRHHIRRRQLMQALRGKLSIRPEIGRE